MVVGSLKETSFANGFYPLD